MIQYQILRSSILRILWQTVRRITNEILDSTGLWHLSHFKIPKRYCADNSTTDCAQNSNLTSQRAFSQKQTKQEFSWQNKKQILSRKIFVSAVASVRKFQICQILPAPDLFIRPTSIVWQRISPPISRIYPELFKSFRIPEFCSKDNFCLSF